MEKMDNILKLLIGVLGVSGLLAMLVPSGFAPPEPAPITSEAPPSAEPTDAAPAPPEPTMSDGEAYDFKIGEPTIDGKPIADPSSPSPVDNSYQPPSEPAPIGNGDFAPPADAGSAAPQPGGEMITPAI